MDFNSQLEAIKAQGKPQKAPAQAEEKKFPKETILTKYFNPMVDKTKGQTKATFQFRILPTTDGSSPFKELKVHTGLQINGKWEKFVCLSSFGLECPLCETEEGLKKQGNKELAKKYRASDYWVVKGIERGKEHEGVKYWRFKKKYDGQGEFDKIAELFEAFGFIADPDTGYDLHITCTLTSKNQKTYSTVSQIICVKTSPLSENKQLAEEWINDDSTWKDVYRPKAMDGLTPTEYLELVAQGKAPYWDDAQKKMIRPAKEAQAQAQSDLNDELLGVQPSKPSPTTSSVAENPLLKDESFDDVDVSDDDDLPF